MTRVYGRGPLHLVGHATVIAITAYVLSIMFQARFAPQPLNLVLWLLGAAVLHDVLFLPLYGVANALLARGVGAADDTSLRALALGPSADEHARQGSPTRDGRRAVPVVNHVRVPMVISATLFLVFLPRILDRQPQNFVNALGHAPPDYLGRWLAVSAALVVGSALLYAVRRLRAAAR